MGLIGGRRRNQPRTHPFSGTTILVLAFVTCLMKSSGFWGEQAERGVMAGNDRLQIEEIVHRIGRGARTHGEAVADRHEADLRLVELLDQLHVAEQAGIAEMVDRRLRREPRR